MRGKDYRSLVSRSLAAVLLLGLMTFSVSGAAAAFKNIKVGDQALPVQLRDLDGQEQSLAMDKDAKAVLMLFWATWSQRSLEELEDLKKLQEQYGEKGLRILAINVENQEMDSSDIDQVRKAVEDLAVAFPVLIDTGLKTYNEWGVIATPTTAIVDGDGVVSFDLSSYPTSGYDEMDEAVQKVLGLWVEEVVDEDAVPAYQPTREALLHMGLGKRHAEKGFMTKALPELEKAAVADSGWADPHIYLGYVHMREGDDEKAGQSLDRAAGLDPGREETVLLTAYLRTSDEKVDDAVALLQSSGFAASAAGEPAGERAAEGDGGAQPAEAEAAAGEDAAAAAPGLDLTGVLALKSEGKGAEAGEALAQLLAGRLGELGFTVEKKKKVDAMEKMRLMMQKKQQGQ